MKVKKEIIKVQSGSHSIQCHIYTPTVNEKFPGIIFFSDIFQITPAMERACLRMASHGYVVAAPEIFGRVLEKGSSLPFTDQGRDQGLTAAASIETKEFDEDCRQTLLALKHHPQVSGKVGCAGFCIGGHLSFRAAIKNELSAAVCFYPTGIHNGALGKDKADTLSLIPALRSDCLIFFGSEDPHIPLSARETLYSVFKSEEKKVKVYEVPCEHAFMRDEGPRYDAEHSDFAWKESLVFFDSHLKNNKQKQLEPILELL